MYAEGHAGLTLAISSLLMIPFGDRYETTIFIVVATLLATLPDIDLSWQRKGYPIHHWGPTHSILAAIICGVLSAIVLYYLYKTWVYVLVGFGAGFTGIVTHLIGDMLTHMKFKPLWPFRDYEVAMGLVGSANQQANNLMVILGILCFAFYAMQ